MRKLIGILSLAFLAGCGTPGAPQPPSLHLPEPVRDLRASRKGDKVTLTWTQPTETTDHEAVGRWLGRLTTRCACHTACIAELHRRQPEKIPHWWQSCQWTTGCQPWTAVSSGRRNIHIGSPRSQRC